MHHTTRLKPFWKLSSQADLGFGVTLSLGIIAWLMPGYHRMGLVQILWRLHAIWSVACLCVCVCVCVCVRVCVCVVSITHHLCAVLQQVDVLLCESTSLQLGWGEQCTLVRDTTQDL